MSRSLIVLLSAVVTLVCGGDPYLINKDGVTGTAALDIINSNPNGQWTEYLDINDVVGTGDFETLYMYERKNVDCDSYCLNPLLLEASLVDDQSANKDGLANLVSKNCLRFTFSSSPSSSGFTGGIGAKCKRNTMLTPDATCVAVCQDYNAGATCDQCVDMKIRFYCPENPIRCSNEKRSLEAEERALEDKDFEIETELEKKREQKNKEQKRKLLELLKQVFDQ